MKKVLLGLSLVCLLLFALGGTAGAQPPTLMGLAPLPPTTRVPYAATGVRGRTAALKYKVSDPVPNGGKATVTIKLKNRAGKVVKTLGPALKVVNSTLTWKFTVPRTWKVGTYHFYVYAKDTAGNAQTPPAGSNKLVVK